jgi:PKD repeat protein
MRNYLKIVTATILITAAFTACNDDNVAPEITTFAVTDTTIRVGTHLELEAKIQSEQAFNYYWHINNEQKSTESVFVFTPEKSGEYTVKLLVENKYGTDSTEAIITVLPQLITVDFENITLGTNSFWNGSDGTGGVTSGVAFMQNFYDQTYMYWEGFAVSNQNNLVTEGYTNQYSVYDPNNNGNKFAVFYPPYFGVLAVKFENNQMLTVESINVCNNSYTALSMLKGDFVAKKFGGTSGNDEDFLKLTINGLDSTGHLTAKVDFYLADFRFADNTQDYIVNKWTKVDLTSLGAVNQLTFTFQSSDNGDWGMNTPAYVCVDDIVYNDPEN